MENLAGQTNADLEILKELSQAGIEIIEGEKSRGEVSYTLTGKLGDWKFERAWYYWMASTNGKGISRKVADELNNREYSGEGQEKIQVFGQVVRVDGYAVGMAVKGEIDSYHIDTQEGLNALAATIRNYYNLSADINDPEKIQKIHDKLSTQYDKWNTESKDKDFEWLIKKVEITCSDGTMVEELIVGIRVGNCEICSIAKKWKDSEFESTRISQYFFKNGEESGFNFGHFRGPGRTLNRGIEIDSHLRPHYEELKALRPESADSLETCLQALEKPGPNYED